MPGAMGLGQLGYPGSWVIRQHGRTLPPSTETRVSVTPMGPGHEWFKGRTPHCGMPWLLAVLQSPTWASSGRKTTSRAAQPQSMLCWGCTGEQHLYPCRAATLRGWMAACSPAFPAGAIPRGDTVVPLQAGSLLLSAVLIAPYLEMLPLARLQETLHQPPEQANPAHSPGTPSNAWSLSGPAAWSHRWQRDGCQGWQAEGKEQLGWPGLTRRGAELLQPAPGGGESILSSLGTNPPRRPPSQVAGPSRAPSNINSPSAGQAARPAAAPSHHGAQHSPRLAPPASPGSSAPGSPRAAPGAQRPTGTRAHTQPRGHLPAPRHPLLAHAGGGLCSAGGEPVPLRQHPFPR